MQECYTGGANLIVGAQWGDEGKGKIADIIGLEEGTTIGVKPQGGHNAGHTLHIDREKYALHGLPSIVVQEDKDAVVGASVYSNPVGWKTEVEELRKQGIELTKNRLMLSYEANIVMPHHIYLDETREGSASCQGSTKQGIAFAAADKYERVGLDGYELVDMSRTRLIDLALDKFLMAKSSRGEDSRRLTPDEFDKVREWANAAEFQKPFFGDGIGKIRQALRNNETVLVEGSQGMWLDIDHGPHKIGTSSHVDVGGILNGSGIPIDEVKAIYAVIKAYKSRVGNGPFLTRFEDDDLYERMKGNPGDPGYEAGTTTKRDRDLGYLDLPEINESLDRLSLKRSDIVKLVVTKLDLLNLMGPTIRVATHHVLDGNKSTRAAKSVAQLERSTPYYEEIEGWSEDISQITSYEDLPRAAKSFIHFLESHLDIQVSMLGVGAERSQIIDRR